MTNRLYDIVYQFHNWHVAGETNKTTPVSGAWMDVLSYIKHQGVDGPAITAKDVTDYGNVDFVADPFFYEEQGRIHMLFEVYNKNRGPTASIGHAVSRNGGRHWEYDRIVFETDRHVSFPYIFKHNSEVYFVPDFSNTNDRFSPVILYRFDEFPYDYTRVAKIVDTDQKFMDTVIFPYGGRWWALMGSGENDQIRIYHNETLTEGNWQSHPLNPVVTDRKYAGRPGGRPLIHDEKLVIFYQDCVSDYGNALRAYEIRELSLNAYKDEPVFDDPILKGKGGRGWNSGRMHHLDIQFGEDRIFIAVDGDIGVGRSVSKAMWSIGFESVPLTT